MTDSQEELGYIEVLIECPFCGGYVPDDFECLKCNSEILEEVEYEQMLFICSKCREEVMEDTEQCPHCGAILK
ncbi:MAG: hypothetical protein R6U17_03580 [Thermoplasmata archaeon]